MIADQARAAFLDATGHEPDAFDKAWSRWVEKEYDRR